jgi:hypothetical protein
MYHDKFAKSSLHFKLVNFGLSHGSNVLPRLGYLPLHITLGPVFLTSYFIRENNLSDHHWIRNSP